MPLSRQLVIAVSLVLLMGFSGAFVINVHDTREYLSRQLESHAQDAATSLGVSISQYLAAKEMIHVESFVDAVFDRGYYRRIVVTDANGANPIERAVAVQVHGVPGWFVRLLPLAGPSATAQVQAGWQQAGTVTVSSHPGTAYAQLWNAARKTMWWCLSLFVLTLAGMTMAVRAALRPLESLERQAVAISRRDFWRLEPVPKARELARVVTAMNDMVGRVEAMLHEQHDQAQHLRDQVYVDPTTGLGNTRAFERDLDNMVRRREEHCFGAVLYVGVSGLEEANRGGGLESGNDLLRTAARRLSERLGGEGRSVARVGGSLFAAVVADVDRENAARLAATVLEDLADLSPEDEEDGGNHVGLAHYNGGQSAVELATEAQAALRNAEREGRGTWHSFAPAETAGGPEIFEEERWRGLLEDAIEGVSISLLAQPVKSAALSETLHLEVLARIKDERGETVPAGVFFPMAARLNLTPALDRLITEAVLWHLRHHPQTGGTYAVNLARASVLDRSFVSWLMEILAAEPAAATRLCFEITAHAVRRMPREVSELASRLRELGAGFGLDHVGAEELELEHIRQLKPDYLKIDGAFVDGLDADLDRQAYVRSLVTVGHGLESLVVAEFVETEGELATVGRLGFDGVQGLLVGGPQKLAG